MRDTNKFRPGKTGACEALLFEFRERGADPTADPVKIAASDMFEAVKFLSWDQPEFSPVSAVCLGLITMVSGSPLG